MKDFSQERWLFIINSTAGHGKTGKKINQLVLNLNKYGFDYEIKLTKYTGHAIELAKLGADAGYHKIISMGGDGTAFEVVNGIMQSENRNNVVMGMLPEGTVNDFARVFHLPHDVKKAVQRFKQQKIINLDLGKIEDYYFLNTFGLGFDAVVAKNVNDLKRFRGLIRYAIGILKAMVHYRNYHAVLEMNEIMREINFILFSVGNGKFCGNGFKLTPNAQPNDGKLDIGIVSGLTRKRLLKLLSQSRRGNHLHRPEVEMLRADKFKISSEKPLPYYLDGEIPKLKNDYKIEVELIPGCLSFLI